MTRLGVLNFGLRHVARPFLASTKSPDRAETDFLLASRIAFLKPRQMQIRTSRLLHDAHELPISRITCGEVDETAAILYFHGGGYVSGSAWTHRGMLARLSLLSGLPVIAADYRLAHYAPFPAAFEDARTAWEIVTKVAPKLSASRIILGGDSAGGGLALSLLAALLQDNQRPAGLFTFSPWTDLTLTGQSLEINEAKDAILPRARMSELCEIILNGADPADPRVSPLFAAFKDPPPCYFQASETEILLDDARRMADRLRAAGGAVTLDLWPDCPHVWQLFDGWIPEARDALEKTAYFAKSCVNPALLSQSES